jgi:molybdopterin converting factor small subunit
MSVTIEYSAQIQRALGLASERIELGSNRTVQGIMEALAHRHGERFRNFAQDDGGTRRGQLLLAVNDEQVFYDTPLELRDGDVLRIMAPMAGG